MRKHPFHMNDRFRHWRSPYWLRSFSFVLVTFSFAAPPRTLTAREWSSADGKFRVNAELDGFDGDSVELSTADGRNISVPVEKLSARDRQFLWTQVHDPMFAGGVPQALIDFQSSMESTRALEIKRTEDRLKKLRRELSAGARQMNHPIAGQARAMTKQLSARLTRLKSGKPSIPTLSPKDFRVGQIGTLDDDLVFGVSADGDGDERKVSVSFIELRSTLDIDVDAGSHASWHVSTINRPDLMYIRSDFASQLPMSPPDRDPNSPINQMLRQHVYRIVEQRPRGLARDYVLSPFDMQDVHPLLLGRRPKPLQKNNPRQPPNHPAARPGEPLPDLVFKGVTLRPFSRGQLQMAFTIENRGSVDYFERATTLKIYQSEDQTFTRGVDKQLMNLRVPLNVPANQSYSGKFVIPSLKRDRRLRYLLFVINANHQFGETTYDNNAFVGDTLR